MTEVDADRYKQLCEGLKGTVADSADDRTKKRFLCHTANDVARARGMLIDYTVFKKKFHVDRLTACDVREELERDVFCMLDKKDKNGRPMMVVRWKNFHPDKIDDIEVSQATTYLFERIMAVEPPVTHYVVLLDYKDWALSQSSPRIAKMVLDLAKRYPLVPASYAVNVPWYFRMVWKVVKPWMTAEAVEKFNMLSSSEVAKAVGPENAPEEFGGTYNFDREAWLQSLFHKDNVKKGRARSQSIYAAYQAQMDTLSQDSETVREGCAFEGPLMKQGSGGYFGTTSWKSRYFVLKGSQLYYFTAKKADKPNRVYELAMCDVHPAPAGAKTEKKHTFYLSAGGGKVTLAAASDAERDEWVKRLEDLCGARGSYDEIMKQGSDE